MKKTYVTPSVEKVEFNYSEQVVAASGSRVCMWVNTAVESGCDSTNAPTYNV